MRSLGVRDLATRQGIAACYPLHPLSALVLPELCSRYGQHERTLFSFLAGSDPASARSFLACNAEEAGAQLPSVGLARVYDYFVSNGVGAQHSSRWTEVAVRIRDSHGLSSAEDRLVKAIAVLNLISSGGTIRASRHVLSLTDSGVDETLVGLEAAGIVTYRDFADEYRIWQGTDVDVRRRLDAARRQVERPPLVEILSALDAPSAVVAARHSAENQTLRVFKRRYASGNEVAEPPDAASEYDGEVLLVVDSHSEVPTLAQSMAHFAKPVVAAIPRDLTALDAAAREVAAVNLALQDSAITDDWVARRELGERLAQTRAILDAALSETFGFDDCRWLLLGSDNGSIELARGRGSAPLSQAADYAYSSTPIVRNEMLNRTSLTSQGAKARRMVLEAMINDGDKPDLGLSGYGPEVAIYEAFLKHGGLHGADAHNHTMAFRRPTGESLKPAWGMLVDEFRRAKTRRTNLRDIYTILQSPPIGMKRAVVPVLLTAGLLAYSDEVAIYEHGTFKPLLTSELSQRMVRNPIHFEIKHFSNTTGARGQVIDSLASRLGVKLGSRKHRVGNVLAVVGDLVTRIRGLDNYTRRTRDLTSMTHAARDVLLAAVEPDDLLFTNLPKVLGFAPVPADTDTYQDSQAYAEDVAEVMEELESAYPSLLNHLLEMLLTSSVETSRLAITGQAAALVDEVLDPSVRAFVLTLANPHLESDTDWIKTVATVVTQKAPAEWRDEDLRRFEYELPQQVAAFRRLVALHTQHRAGGGGPFDAFRVTFTRPDGREDVRLVSVDHDEREQLDHAFRGFIQQMTEVTGSPQRTQHALLALLGERLLPSPRTAQETPTNDAPDRWVQHG